MLYALQCSAWSCMTFDMDNTMDGMMDDMMDIGSEADDFNLYGGGREIRDADPLTDDFAEQPGAEAFDVAADIGRVEMDKTESVAPMTLRGVFVGDEDGDGDMEIY